MTPQRTSLLFDRWPRYASRKPWLVVAGVVAIIAILAVGSNVAGGAYNDNFSIPGTDSQKAFDILSERFPQRAGDAATVVVKVEAGLDAVETEVREMVAEFAALPGVAEDGAQAPYDVPGSISQDGTIARFDVTYTLPAFEVDPAHVEELFALRDELSTNAIQVELGGAVTSIGEQEEPGTSEIIGIIAAIIILLIAFGSVVAMGLPIVTALLGLIPGFMIISIMSAFVDMASFTPQFASMIGIGVGIDYALLIVTRFREGLKEGASLEDAIARAMSTAGRAVLFAGSIVVIALFGLWASGLPFIGWVATAAAILVATLVIVALFVLPAALRIIGARIDSLAVPFILKKHTSGEGGAGATWAGLIARNPVPALVLALVVLLVVASPVLSIRLGSADAGGNPETATSRRAYDLLSEGFGAGFNGPILIVFDVGGDSAPALEALPEQVEGLEGVAFATPVQLNQQGTAGIMTVIPQSAPQDEATGELVDRLRGFLSTALVGTGAQGYVGGLTAVFIDIAEKMSAGLLIFIPAVLTLSIVLLAIVFRSIIVPIKAALMIALSVGVGFGVVTAVFQLGWGASLIGVDSTGPVESFLPMMLFAVLFGLSMDYEVFLITRVHEEYLTTGDGKLAAERGHAKTFRVIIAAALIMSSVFFSFILVDFRVIKEFGLGLGIAILADALIVRMVLVPAIMQLFGNRAWAFPATLDRLLPRMSVEGEPATAPAGGSGE